MISDILNTNLYDIKVVASRAIFSLVSLFLITKMIGKKQVSELNLFDYVISISIGNFAAEMTMNLDSQVLNGFVSMFIFGFIATFVSILTMKSIKLRRFFMGTPTLIMQDGKFVFNNLKKIKFDMNDFLETARAAGYFDVSNIKYAIMEANGKISFLPKEEYLPINNKGMNVKISPEGLCANVIIDGMIMENNIINSGKEVKWIKEQLKKMGHNKYSNILLAILDVNDKLVIYEKDAVKKIKDVLE